MGNIINVPANTELLNVTAAFNIDLISSATLRNADRQIVTDVSGQPIGTDTLSRNVGN